MKCIKNVALNNYGVCKMRCVCSVWYIILLFLNFKKRIYYKKKNKKYNI